MTLERAKWRSRLAHVSTTLVVACGSASLLAGCSSSFEETTPTSTNSFTGTVPTFEGPYAAQFAENYVAAGPDFVRKVLEDGQITDAEYAEMTQRFSDCLADDGIDFGGFAPDGGYETSLAPNDGDTHAKITSCSKSVGEDRIGSLYTFIRTNPDSLDYAVIIPQCLVDAGVVPAGYGPEDFEADNLGRFRDLTSLEPELRDAVTACTTDPLGLLGE